MAKCSGALIHHEIRWPDCLVLVDDELIIVERTAGDHLGENLALD